MKRTAGRLASVALAAGWLSLSSCAGDIVIDRVDEDNWSTFKTSYAVLKDAATTRSVIPVEIRSESVVDVRVQLTKGVGEAVDVEIAYDPSLVDVYNGANYTEYQPLPSANVSVGGPAAVRKWQTESSVVTVSLTCEGLEEGTTYLLPLRASTLSSEVVLSESSEVLYYLVKPVPSIPDNTKYVPGESDRTISTLCYVEVNGADLRNVGIYELENSGKKFFDMAVIFAANIKCNTDGRVFLHINENITHILDHADVYIKPLQDQGIKVLMGLLGGGDFAGLASLRGESMRDFAAQCKNLIDVYGLDGVDFDDEWSSYNTGSTSMWANSGTHFARLIIETRRIMPDKIITVFEYNAGRQMTSALVDGIAIADQIDYSMQASYDSWRADSYIAGMSRSKYSPYAYWINNSSASNMNTRTQQIRSGGYGFFFCYDLNDRDATTVLSTASNNLFGERVVRIRDSYVKSF